MTDPEFYVEEARLDQALTAFLEKNCPRSDLLPPAREKADPLSTWLVAKQGDRLAGACSFLLLEEMGRVDVICAEPEELPKVFEALFAEALKRTKEAERRRFIVAGVDSRMEVIRVFLEKRGFRTVNDYIRMEYKGADLPEVELPKGYGFRTYRPGDEEEWARCINRAYETERDKARWTPEKVRTSFVKSPSFMRDGCFFVTHGSRIVGACMAWKATSKGSPWGRLHWLGVDPEHRRRGIARFLAVKVVRHLLSNGLDRIYLVTSYTYSKAIPLYKSLGFVEVPRVLDYYIDL